MHLNRAALISIMRTNLFKFSVKLMTDAKFCVDFSNIFPIEFLAPIATEYKIPNLQAVLAETKTLGYLLGVHCTVGFHSDLGGRGDIKPGKNHKGTNKKVLPVQSMEPATENIALLCIVREREESIRVIKNLLEIRTTGVDEGRVSLLHPSQTVQDRILIDRVSRGRGLDGRSLILLRHLKDEHG